MKSIAMKEDRARFRDSGGATGSTYDGVVDRD